MTEQDVLGEPYTRETLEFPDDYEGPVVATLVHRVREPGGAPTRGAVLHVHGFCDYFFQTVTADFYTALGFDFYRRRPAQVRSIAAAPPDAELLPRPRRVLRGPRRRTRPVSESGRDTNASSSAGTRREGCSLRSGRRPERPTVTRSRDALVLNSPWLDLQGSFFVRTAGTEAINRLGQRRPYATVPRSVTWRVRRVAAP